MTLDEALAAARDDDWAARKAAAEALGEHLEVADAYAVLVALLDDGDTAVVHAAARALAQDARGLVEALRAQGSSDDSVGHWVRNAMIDLEIEEGGLGDRVELLLGHDDPAVHRAVTEVLLALGRWALPDADADVLVADVAAATTTAALAAVRRHVVDALPCVTRAQAERIAASLTDADASDLPDDVRAARADLRQLVREWRLSDPS